MNDEGNLVYTYSITIQNLSAFSIYYKANMKSETLPDGVTVSGTNITNATAIAASGSAVFTVVYTLDPAEIEDLQTFNWNFGAIVELASTSTGFAA